ncbi:sugar-transfer associated ATP-grasp domain-containing protein [Halalkalibacillus halophilus]|uniref:sugar-transfer associated ATP-grasp domain-containing protein n=1 Tax=Halalkalibacillus halophilus TaxID=392827 RepID=UPI00040596E1|nr:sugar-transfer associated ATP-grasp domain-containing protein [Halalkalibacillus halophilus]
MSRTFYLTIAGQVNVKEEQDLLGQNISLIKKLTENSDFFLLNLNSTLTKHTPSEEVDEDVNDQAGKIKDVAKNLEELNVNAVATANEYTFSTGHENWSKIEKKLAKRGIQTVGSGKNKKQASKPLELVIKGENQDQKVFFFNGMNSVPDFREKSMYAEQKEEGVNSLAPNMLEKEIELLREKEPDSVILVMPYWYSKLDHYYSHQDNIREKYNSILYAGADYVFGLGSPFAQGVDRTGKGTVAYSLGDVFPNKNKDSYANPYSLVANIKFIESENGWQVIPEIFPIKRVESEHGAEIQPLTAIDCADMEEQFSEQKPLKKDLYDYSFRESENGYYFVKDFKKSVLEDVGMPVNRSLYRRFKHAGLLQTIDFEFIQEVQDYWHNIYQQQIDPIIHVAHLNMYGKNEKRIIPTRVWKDDLEPYLNFSKNKGLYSDKNIYDLLIATDQMPETIIKRVRDQYFNSSYVALNEDSAWETMISVEQDLVIKPSTTNNGESIKKLTYHNGSLLLNGQPTSIQQLEFMYGSNFIVQKKIKQHPIMAAPHEESVNTIRLVTLRWKEEIHFLFGVARFGANGYVNDNSHVGGVSFGLDSEGRLKYDPLDESANVRKIHPTTGFKFDENFQVPNYEACKEFVKELHKYMLFHDFINWDIAIDEEGKPIFIENNFTKIVWIFQLELSEPLLGDFTEEIVKTVRKEIDRGNPKRDFDPIEKE